MKFCLDKINFIARMGFQQRFSFYRQLIFKTSLKCVNICFLNTKPDDPPDIYKMVTLKGRIQAYYDPKLQASWQIAGFFHIDNISVQ